MNEYICELLENEITPNIEKKLKKLIQPYKKGCIGIAQINPIAGDIEYNARKVIKYINIAQNIDLDLIVFPELILMGYPIEDTIDRHKVIVENNIKWLQGIAKNTANTAAIVGFVEPRASSKTGKNYYNSIAILFKGKIQGIVRKSLLPTYSEFNDYRYFEPSPVVGCQSPDTLCDFDENKVQNCSKLITINGIKYGISICEDCWNDKDFFNNNVMYKKDPIEELAKEKPNILINCSASPTRVKKEQLKHNMLSFISKKYAVPFVYVNQVGAIDNYSFDGSSRVFDKNGKMIARAKCFEEQFLIVNPIKNLGKIYPLPKGLEKSLTEIKEYKLEYESDLERTYKTIIQGIQDYFKKNGFKKAVIGLSGGLDSSICAVLLTDALGKENVLGVSMPSKLTSYESKNDAKILAQNLEISFIETSIENVVDSINDSLQNIFKKIDKKWNTRFKKSLTMDNIQARSRALFLWGISNEFEKTLPIATSDKSELYMGYATINGDMSGGFAPIADVPKTKLFALAKWINKNRNQRNVIPQSVINKKPGAELSIDSRTGKPLTAEDALMPYEFLDEIIWRIENKKENYDNMLNSQFLYEKKNIISKIQKINWLDKFYKRMSNSIYKWSILPPSVIVDAHSITKYDYKQPITSSHICYKKISKEQICKKIAEWNQNIY